MKFSRGGDFDGSDFLHPYEISDLEPQGAAEDAEAPLQLQEFELPNTSARPGRLELAKSGTKGGWGSSARFADAVGGGATVAEEMAH